MAMACRNWELLVAIPGILAWLVVLLAAVLTLAARATPLTQACCIGAIAVGMVAFLLAASLGGVCDRSRDPPRWPRLGARSDAELRMKLHLGAILGALPALGGAGMLGLFLNARRKDEPAVPPARRS